ncbi:serine kinase [uncultured Litoreibacter sp.]|uniref:HPr kinase/phosphorylase n=1 Tax=uncultured Litoreibacter sp. TaxID=1392394 RepID=UPI002614D657|nr:serine kinase [uncultured Litoreibacter sp.]
MPTDHTELYHATAVSIDGAAVLMTGASGSGKSSLALQLIAIGAGLIADDQCDLFSEGGALWVRKPRALPALIEARGIGLLPAPLAPPAKVRLIVDMDSRSEQRLPEDDVRRLMGHDIKMIKKIDGSHFPAAISLYLRGM